MQDENIIKLESNSQSTGANELDEMKKRIENLKQEYENAKKEYESFLKQYTKDEYIIAKKQSKNFLVEFLDKLIKFFEEKAKWDNIQAKFIVETYNYILKQRDELIKNKIKEFKLSGKHLDTIEYLFTRYSDTGLKAAQDFIFLLEPILETLQEFYPKKYELKQKENIVNAKEQDYLAAYHQLEKDNIDVKR